MQEQIQWVSNQVASFEDTTRQSKWNLDQLQDQRTQLRAVWDDACSEDVARRFLNPQARDAEEALHALGEQIRQLQSVSSACGKAYTEFEHVMSHSTEIERLMGDAGNLFRTLDSLVSEVNHRTESSDHHVSQSEILLVEANLAGQD
jgi:hypothetical protein